MLNHCVTANILLRTIPKSRLEKAMNTLLILLHFRLFSFILSIRIEIVRASFFLANISVLGEYSYNRKKDSVVSGVFCGFFTIDASLVILSEAKNLWAGEEHWDDK